MNAKMILVYANMIVQILWALLSAFVPLAIDSQGMENCVKVINTCTKPLSKITLLT